MYYRFQTIKSLLMITGIYFWFNLIIEARRAIHPSLRLKSTSIGLKSQSVVSINWLINLAGPMITYSLTGKALFLIINFWCLVVMLLTFSKGRNRIPNQSFRVQLKLEGHSLIVVTALPLIKISDPKTSSTGTYRCPICILNSITIGRLTKSEESLQIS